MIDPLIALMYAVQVMNFLKDKEESPLEDVLLLKKDPFEGNRHQKPNVTLAISLRKDPGITVVCTAPYNEVSTCVKDYTSSSQSATVGQLLSPMLPARQLQFLTISGLRASLISSGGECHQ
jgi:hypothetical protein